MSTDHLQVAESTPEVLTVRFNNPEGTTMTPALINAIRRIILSETPSISLGLGNNRMILNSSAFNTDYLRDRLALIPVYQQKFDHLKPYVETTYEYDEEAYDKGLQNEDSGDENEDYEPDETLDRKNMDVKLLFRICDRNDWSQSLKNPNPGPLKVTVNKHLLILKKKPEHLNLKFTINQLSVDPTQTTISTDIAVDTETQTATPVVTQTVTPVVPKPAPKPAPKPTPKSTAKKQEGGAKTETLTTATSESDATLAESGTISDSEFISETDETVTEIDAPATISPEVASDEDDEFVSDDDEIRDQPSGLRKANSEAVATTLLSGHGPDLNDQTKPEDLEEPEEPESESSEGPLLTTHEDWTTYYEEASPEEFKEWMKYDFYLLMLKSTEEILHNIVPSLGIGREHCTFAPCTIAGYYFGDQPRPTHPGKFARSKWYSEYPAQISLSLEFNGHYPNNVVIEQAILKLISKIEDFRLSLLGSINAETIYYDFEANAQPVIDLTERFAHDFTETEKENFMVLKVNKEDQTLGQLVAIYGSLFFQELFKNETEEKRQTLIQNSFCSYRRPSPLEHEIQISIKTPNKELWPGQFVTDGTSSDLSRPMQVLMEILSVIDKLLQEIKQEFDDKKTK